mmetsp:Transcript_7394/g.13636  ORF Transcript_7394/g.13636 Transcript_7394/m.13636 type:complete len:202 (-) Transcript_7394:5-610(-)
MHRPANFLMLLTGHLLLLILFLILSLILSLILVFTLNCDLVKIINRLAFRQDAVVRYEPCFYRCIVPEPKLDSGCLYDSTLHTHLLKTFSDNNPVTSLYILCTDILLPVNAHLYNTVGVCDMKPGGQRLQYNNRLLAMLMCAYPFHFYSGALSVQDMVAQGKHVRCHISGVAGPEDRVRRIAPLPGRLNMRPDLRVPARPY